MNINQATYLPLVENYYTFTCFWGFMKYFYTQSSVSEEICRGFIATDSHIYSLFVQIK